MTSREPRTHGLLETLVHSVAAKIVVIVVVFFAVPMLLYDQFRAADADKRTLLLDSLKYQGRMVGETLRPQLSNYDGEALRGIADTLQRLGGVGGLKIKLLLRPAKSGDPSGFYYIASAPAVSGDYLEEERAELVETGILERLRDSCAGNRPLAVRYVNPAGEAEVLTSVTPVQTQAGCWAIITSHASTDGVGAILGQPYWQTPEVKVALAIYLIMAALVILMFVGVWRSLRRFARTARQIRSQGLSQTAPQFTEINQVPELDGVALEFDRMVETLRSAAHVIRLAAEDNAHAFKTPIATISQSLEPIRRMLNGGESRAHRALELIERSLDRLDALVGAARRMDQATAEMMEASRTPLDLSKFVARTLDGYGETARTRGVGFERTIDERLIVTAAEDMLETVLENLLDNAIDFSPADENIAVSLNREGHEAVLRVCDRGPGVEPDRIDQIFERYVSTRAQDENAGNGHGDQHFGIGLWLVRRNVEALEGRVTAKPANPHGLCMEVRLPLKN